MIQIKSNRLLNSFKSFLIKFTTNLWKRNFYFCFLSFDSFFLYSKIFILNQNAMFYMSFDSSNQDESNVIIFMNRALNIIQSVKIFSIFGKY